jgi:hypothetical protein
MASTPSGSISQFLIIGRVREGAPADLATTMAGHGARLLPSGGFKTYEPGRFVWTTFVDFSRSTSSVERVLRDIQKLGFVTYAEARPMADRVFDNFVFPVTILGSHRAVVLRTEPLLRIERRLMEALGPSGEAIMFDAGADYGTETARRYAEALPGASPAMLLASIRSDLRATGWGLFEFELSALHDSSEAEVAIREPPNSVMPGIGETPFVNGIAVGVTQSLTGIQTRVAWTKYDPVSRTLTVKLAAATTASPRPGDGNPILPRSSYVRATEFVSRGVPHHSNGATKKMSLL